MPATSPSIARYLAAYEALHASRAGEPAFVRAARAAAIERFAALGFPTPALEDWKYTSVDLIAAREFVAAPATTNGLTAAGAERLGYGLGGTRLVFVNGHLRPDLSTSRLEAGVWAGSLARLLAEDPGAAEPHLGRIADLGGRAFPALNAALAPDGAAVLVPRGAVVAEPIHLIYVAAPGAERIVAHPRNLLVAGEGSEVTFVESFVAAGAGVAWHNALTEIVLEDGAQVRHVRVQRQGEEEIHTSAVAAEVGRDASFASHVVSTGGRLTRNDLDVRLVEPGADCSLDGLYLLAGSQHLDNHTHIDHATPRGTSRELYKGVLSGASRGVFNGRIRVRKDAQKTDARQTNRNLLLSDSALVDTKPELEIFADDVKCTHGATIGQLDEASLFYLRSRGLSADAGRSLLIHAFAAEVIDRIPLAPLRAGLESDLLARLPDYRALQEEM
jgi:Fe-S cluster assembly protein SufD